MTDQVAQSFFLKPSELPKDFLPAAAHKISKTAEALKIHDPLPVKNIRIGDDRFGTLFHNAIAASCHEALAGKPCGNIIGPLVTAWGFSENIEVKDLEKTNQQFMAWSRIKFGATNANVKTELPILVPGETSTGLQWVRGQIDMVIECADKVVVIDHKTSSLPETELEAYSKKYFNQLSLYVSAMSYYANKPVEVWLYYPLAGVCVRCEK